MPPMVPPLAHRGERFVAARARTSLHNDDVLDRYAFLERFVGVALERHDLATTVATVCGDEHFALCVVDPIAQRLRRESAEDDGMNRADASTGEHRDRCFGDERHV